MAPIAAAGFGRRHHDHRSDRRRRPDRRREAQREAPQLARRGPGLRGPQGAGRAQPAGPGPGRRRDHGLRHAGLRAVAQHRPQRRARGRLARVGARHHHRPPVRIVAAGHPLRRPGRHGRGLRHRRRRRRRVHDPHAHGLLGRARLRLPLRAAHDGPLHRQRGPQRAEGPGHRRRDDRRPVGHLARGARRLLGAEPPAGRPGHRRGPLRERDRARGRPRRRGQGHRRDLRQPTRASGPTPASRRWPS